MRPRVVVVGPGRSGSSLLMRLLGGCGLDVGAADRLMELPVVREASKTIHTNLHVKPPLDEEYRVPWDSYDTRALHLILGDLPELVKCIHLTFLGENLLHVFPGAVFVRPVRDVNTSASSLHQKYWVSRTLEECRQHTRYLVARAEDLRKKCDPGQYWEVDMDEVVQGKRSQIQNIAEHLGLRARPPYSEIIKPDLWTKR